MGFTRGEGGGGTKREKGVNYTVTEETRLQEASTQWETKRWYYKVAHLRFI